MEAVGKLTNLQMLAKYFAKSATSEMDRLWDENGWDNETMKAWASEHLRKK